MRRLPRAPIGLGIKLLEQQRLVRAELRLIVPLMLLVGENLRRLEPSDKTTSAGLARDEKTHSKMTHPLPPGYALPNAASFFSGNIDMTPTRSSSETVLASNMAKGSRVMGRARGRQTFMMAQRLRFRRSRSAASRILFSRTVRAPCVLLSQCAKMVGPGAETVSLSLRSLDCSMTSLARCWRTRCEKGRTSVAPVLVGMVD